MAKVFADVGFDMRSQNVFAIIAKAALPQSISDDDFEPNLRPLSDQKGFYVAYNIKGHYEAYDSTSFTSASKLKFGKVDIPGLDLDLIGPIGGTIDTISTSRYLGQDAKGNANWLYKYTIYDLKIDIAAATAKILSPDFLTNKTKYFAGLEKLFAGTFAGNDDFYGSKDADFFLGFAGNDVFQGGFGADTLNGGAGSDKADYIGAAGRVHVSLLERAANREYESGNGRKFGAGDVLTDVESLRGSRFNDVLKGNDKNNVIGGWGGNDTLFGGKGADTFVFSADDIPANADIVGDFDARAIVNGRNVVFDKIELSHFEYSQLGNVPNGAADGSVWALDAKDFFASTNGAARDADSHLLYNKSNGQLKYDYDGSGLLPAVLIATLYENFGAGGTPLHPQDLSAANFLIRVAPDF